MPASVSRGASGVGHRRPLTGRVEVLYTFDSVVVICNDTVARALDVGSIVG